MYNYFLNTNIVHITMYRVERERPSLTIAWVNKIILRSTLGRSCMVREHVGSPNYLLNVLRCLKIEDTCSRVDEEGNNSRYLQTSI